MEIRYLADRIRYLQMTTEELRRTFLVEDLFENNQLILHYTETDRAIVGSAVPGTKPLQLAGGKELASEYFAERREIGVINIGSTGCVLLDDKSFTLDNREGLYISRGTRSIVFKSDDAQNPAKLYLLSYPAHTEYPSVKINQADAEKVDLGSRDGANVRTIFKYIHPAQVQSCQLVMGLTQIAEGSVWNTMPPHTHERRTEIYMYFDLGDELLFHFMGTPESTRHLVMHDGQAVISPSWSIHAGVGTGDYSFIWGMGGENQEFDDMDSVNRDQII